MIRFSARSRIPAESVRTVPMRCAELGITLCVRDDVSIDVTEITSCSTGSALRLTMD